MESYRFPNKATPAGSTPYYSIRFSPKTTRDSLGFLFLWKQELESLYSLSDPGIARIKLQWWTDQVSEKKGTSEHPLASALAGIYKSSAEASNAFHLMVDANDQLLHRRSFETIDGYLDFCEKHGGSLARLLQLSSGHDLTDKTTMIGSWISHVENIQLLGKRLRENINLIPNDMLRAASLPADQLLHSKKTTDLLLTFHQSVSEKLTYNLPAIRRSKSCLLKLYFLRSKLMKLIEDENMAVINQRISLTPIRKLWLSL